MASKDLIDTIIAEAGGEGDEGIIAATWAIAQRAAARGQTMDQVIKQGFDGYTNPGSGAVKMQRDQAIRQNVERIVNGVQRGTIPNPVPGADHFLSGDVMPGWARNMEHVATVNGHRFYASGQVPRSAQGIRLPPGELPQVATLTDTRPRPVSPSTPTPLPPMLAAQRNLQPVSTDTAALYRGIYPAPAPAPRLPARNESMVFGRGISDSVERAQAGQNQSLAAALQTRIAASQRSQPMSVADVYRNDGPTRPPTVAPPRPSVRPVATPSQRVAAAQNNGVASGNDALLGRIGPISQAPQTANVPPPKPRPTTTNDTLRTATVLPPIPPSNSVVPRHFDVTLQRAAAAANHPELAAAIAPAPRSPSNTMIDTSMQRVASAVDPALQRALAAQAASGVGKPPATRSVASVPVPPPVALPAIPGPRSIDKPQDRLPRGEWGVPELQVASALDVVPRIQVVPNLPALPSPMANIGLPTPLSMRPPSVGMMANVPLPRARPVMPVVPRPMAPAPVARQPVRPQLSVVVYSNRLPAPPPVAPQPVNNRYIVNGQAVQKGMSNALAGTSASGFGGDRYDPYSVSTSISG